MKIKIFSIATDLLKSKYLYESAKSYGWEIKIINPLIKRKWKNNLKFKLLIDELEKSNVEMVVLLDGYDVLVQCTPNECYKFIYKNGKDKMLIGDESYYKTPEILRYFSELLPIQSGNYKGHENFINLPLDSTTNSSNYDLGKAFGTNNFKHNSGIILGNRKVILNLYKYFLKETKNYKDAYSDQFIIGKTIKKYPFLKSKIKLIYDNHSLWHVGINPSLYDAYKKNNNLFLPNNKKVLFVHRTRIYNYKSDWRDLIKLSRNKTFKRGFFEKIKLKFLRVITYKEMNITFLDLFIFIIFFIIIFKLIN